MAFLSLKKNRFNIEVIYLRYQQRGGLLTFAYFKCRGITSLHLAASSSTLPLTTMLTTYLLSDCGLETIMLLQA